MEEILQSVDGYSLYIVYPIISKVLYIPGGAGFFPSTVSTSSDSPLLSQNHLKSQNSVPKVEHLFSYRDIYESYIFQPPSSRDDSSGFSGTLPERLANDRTFSQGFPDNS